MPSQKSKKPALKAGFSNLAPLTGCGIYLIYLNFNYFYFHIYKKALIKAPKISIG